MKIVLQSTPAIGVGTFSWNTPPPIDDAFKALEQFGTAEHPKEVNGALSNLTNQITSQIASLLFIITASHCLGGNEGVSLMKETNHFLAVLREKAIKEMERKFRK